MSHDFVRGQSGLGSGSMRYSPIAETEPPFQFDVCLLRGGGGNSRVILRIGILYIHAQHDECKKSSGCKNNLVSMTREFP